VTDLVPTNDDSNLPPVHPASFRHDLIFQNELPDPWNGLYYSLVMKAEEQIKLLFGATVLHTMLIERAAYLFVKQKMADSKGVDVPPKEQAAYNALIRQWLKIAEQLQKYELPQMISPDSAFVYTVIEIIDKEVDDPIVKRRIAERLADLRK